MQKLSVKRVPKCLIGDKKFQRCLSSFWNFLGAIQMISCRVRFAPRKKLGYLTMKRREGYIQWSDGIAAQPAPKYFKLKKSTWGVLRIFSEPDLIFIIAYLPKGQTINAEYYLSLLVQLKDILMDKHHMQEDNKGGLVLAQQCPGSPVTFNPKETGLPGLLMSWSSTLFSGPGPVGLPPVLWTEKIIEMSLFLVRNGGHFCRRDVVGCTNSCNFLSDLQMIEQRSKNFIELRGGCIEWIPSLVAVACFLPGRDKEYSANLLDTKLNKGKAWRMGAVRLELSSCVEKDN